MNDDFLSNFQEPPRPEFADALYQRINKPMKTNVNPARTFALGFSLAALALVLFLIISPVGRVFARSLMIQIGSLFVSNEATYAEQFEQKINATPSGEPPAASPVAVEWQAPPLLSLSEASAQAGFTVLEIGSPPAGVSLVARFVNLGEDDTPFTGVTTTYASADLSLVFSQTAYPAGAAPQTLPAGEATVTPLTVQGVDGLWIKNLRLSTYVNENNRVAPQFANLLVWEKDGFQFWLQATPGLSLEEMLAMAASLQP